MMVEYNDAFRFRVDIKKVDDILRMKFSNTTLLMDYDNEISIPI